MSLEYLLDTNIISAAFRKDPPGTLLSKLGATSGRCAIATLVWHELRYGCQLLEPSRRRRALERYLAEVVRSSFAILDYDHAAAEWHAAERARLVRLDKTPPMVDGQIASIAAVNGLVLVTANEADFRNFDGLKSENWLEDGSTDR